MVLVPAFRLPTLCLDWLIILPIAAIDAVLLCRGPMSLAWRPEIVILLAASALGGIGMVYGRVRHVPRLAHLARMGFFIILFTNAAALFNYLLDGLAPLPLVDHQLDALDHAAGLDWLGLYGWITGHPRLYGISNLIYGLLGPEFLCLLMYMETFGDHRDAVTLRHGFYISGIATIIIGVLLPAAGPFAFYHLPVAGQTAYVAQFAALRDGALRHIDLANAQGLISFPSFHAALAVLCAGAARTVRGLFWPAIILNALIIATAPVNGGHYFIDVVAGMVLAVMIILLLEVIPCPDYGSYIL